MKSRLVLIAFLAFLTGCGSNAQVTTPTPSPTNAERIVPANCELPDVVAAFARVIPPSKYIPTKWTPAEGTDLAAALNSGGIACSYGDQDAEVGGTVLWAPAIAWKEREAIWKSEGMEFVDIPNVDESSAYKLPDGATSADGMPAWKVNLLINGIWIQLGAAFIQSWNEATPIINAAIDATK